MIIGLLHLCSQGNEGPEFSLPVIIRSARSNYSERVNCPPYRLLLMIIYPKAYLSSTDTLSRLRSLVICSKGYSTNAKAKCHLNHVVGMSRTFGRVQDALQVDDNVGQVTRASFLAFTCFSVSVGKSSASGVQQKPCSNLQQGRICQRRRHRLIQKSSSTASVQRMERRDRVLDGLTV
jgi:hypothetical protein